MPLYEYKCPRPACRAEYAALRPMAEMHTAYVCSGVERKHPPTVCIRIMSPVTGIVRNPAVPRKVRG